MAQTTGPDVLVQILEGQRQLLGEFQKMRGEFAELKHDLNVRIDNTNGTLTLIGRVVNELATRTLERVDDHERRITALEGRP